MNLSEYQRENDNRASMHPQSLHNAHQSQSRYLCDVAEQHSYEDASGLLGLTAGMEYVVAQVRRVAPTTATVLIQGESGTGKEITAKAIHEQSRRRHRQFVPINCGAIPPQLIESELFGHEKGSFTGAIRSHRGVFERANGGTLFLDEITEMPMELQVKLLRVLETRRFIRVGSDYERDTDVRIIAATNRCPEEEAAAGRLRSDLMYRLQVFPIELPSLRERKSDVKTLTHFFLDELNREGASDKIFSADAISLLEHYSWPGNIRELKNVVQQAFIMADREITSDELPSKLRNHIGGTVQQKGQTLSVDIGASVAEVEKDLILATLDKCAGRKEKAASILGVSVKTLYNRLRKYEKDQIGAIEE